MKIVLIALLLFASGAQANYSRCLKEVYDAEPDPNDTKSSPKSAVFSEQFPKGLWAYERALLCRNIQPEDLVATLDCMGHVKKELKLQNKEFTGGSPDGKGDVNDSGYAILCSGADNAENRLACVEYVRNHNKPMTSVGIATACSGRGTPEFASRCLSQSISKLKKTQKNFGREMAPDLCANGPAGKNFQQTIEDRSACVNANQVACGTRTINARSLPLGARTIACSGGTSALCCVEDLWTKNAVNLKESDNAGIACAGGGKPQDVWRCHLRQSDQGLYDEDDEKPTDQGVPRRIREARAQLCGGIPEGTMIAAPAAATPREPPSEDPAAQ